MEGLAALVDKSLLRQEQASDVEPRLVMLETVREYALERLESSSEAESLRRRHAEHFVALVEGAEPKLRASDRAAWLGRLEAEHDNLRAVLAWSQGGAGTSDGEPPATTRAEIGLRLAGSLTWFWYLRCYFSEGWRWLESMLATNPGAANALRAKALSGAGILARLLGDFEPAAAYLEKGLGLYRTLNDGSGVAWSLCHLGFVELYRGRDRRAQALAIESLALFRELADTWGCALAQCCLGIAAYARGDRQARALLGESLDLFREVSDALGNSRLLGLLGHATHAEGDQEEALALFEESLALTGELGDVWGVTVALGGLGKVASGQGDHQRAVVLLGAAEALRAPIKMPLFPVDQARFERILEASRVELGEAFAAAWAVGQAMSAERAIAYGLGTEEGAGSAA